RLHTRLSFLILFNPTATPSIYPLSLHDALPIFAVVEPMAHDSADHRVGLTEGQAPPDQIIGEIGRGGEVLAGGCAHPPARTSPPDRKSTRLNSSHVAISYAVFCLKKKNTKVITE